MVRRGGGHLLHGIALCQSAHIQGHVGVGEEGRSGLQIQLQRRQIRVERRLLQGAPVRQRRPVRVLQGLLPGIVPEGQHGPHGCVDPATGLGPGRLRELEQRQNPLIHWDRPDPRLVVDGLQIP